MKQKYYLGYKGPLPRLWEFGQKYRLARLREHLDFPGGHSSSTDFKTQATNCSHIGSRKEARGKFSLTIFSDG
jgi:hypothetical protein